MAWLTSGLQCGIAKLSFKSGHRYIANHFVAKIIPHTGDRSLITCSADGQVRHAQISDHGVRTQMMAKELVIWTLNPEILMNLLLCWRWSGESFSGWDKYTGLYDIRKFKRDGSTDFDQPIGCFYPPHLIGVHKIVTGMAFPDQSELLVLYGDHSVCLFTRDMGLGHNPVPSSPFSARSEASEKVVPQLYKGFAKYERPKCVSFFGPKSEYVSGVLASSGTSDFKIWTPKPIDKDVLPTQTELDKQQHAQFLFLIVISSPLEILIVVLSFPPMRNDGYDVDYLDVHDGNDDEDK
ncbi:hypothetical protein V6N13_122033 [Hibiscus sabdariffa]